MIEAGVRRELERLLGAQVQVAKRSLPLHGTSMRMNPDLVFGDISAVGDVKYKVLSGEWSRSDLNQIVAFAAAARTQTGIVIGFHPSEPSPLPSIGVGDFHIVGLSWRAEPDLDPALAAAELAENIRGRLLAPTAAAA